MTAKSRKILILDDDDTIGTVLAESLRDDGYSPTVIKSLTDMTPDSLAGADLLITDVLLPDGNALDQLAIFKEWAPSLPIIVMSAQNTMTTAMRAAQEGVYEYLPKPFDLDALNDLVLRALNTQGGTYRTIEGVQHDKEGNALIGRSPAMQALYRTMAKVAQTDLSVLISGESGTGKELVANAIHAHGPRASGPFISVNMAAIPSELIESELFGHERGAFTGASRSFEGRFSQASGGTLFLDEIGDMPIEAQTRLLRVLQEGEYRSVGGASLRKANIRVIAASHRSLQEEIAAGRFREDLFFRLNVVPLAVPPLRARLGDIDALVGHFLEQAAEQGMPAKTLSSDAIKLLKSYGWPGNVRELENLVLRLVVLAPDDAISAELVAQHLNQAKQSSRPQEEPGDMADGGLSNLIEHHLDTYFAALGGALPPRGLHGRLVREVEKPLIEKVLALTGGNQVKSAEVLGLNRNTLRQRIKDLGVSIVKLP